jgi:hypothetical protein
MANFINIIRAGRETPLTLQVDEKTVFFRKLMADHRITCEVTVNVVLDIKIADYIVWNTYNYTVNRLPTVEKYSNSNYKYTIYFESNTYDLLKKIFISIDGLAAFSLNETAAGFLSKIVDNINTIQSGWTGTVTGDTGAFKTLQFANESCKSALTRVAQAFSFEFDVVGKAISLKTTIGTALGYSFEYGRDNGLYKIERQQVADQNIITKVYGFGSTKNIPASYRGGAQRLVFEARYLEDTGSIYGVIEGQFTDEDIYPHWPGVLTAAQINFDGGVTYAVSRVDQVTKNSTPGDCTVSCNGYSFTMVWNTDILTTLNDFMTAHEFDFGTVAVLRITVVLDSYLLFYAKVAGVDFAAATITAGMGTAENITPNVVGAAGSTEFNPNTSYLEDTSIYFDIYKDWIQGESVPKIVFTSGLCSGIEFEIYKFDFITKRIYINPYTDADGTITPRYNEGSPIKPAIGDTYTFININLPQENIDVAEAELLTATQAYLDANKNPQVVYTVDIDPKFALTNTIDDINPGDTVEITDAELIGASPITIRIASLEYPLVNIYRIKAVISDFVPYTFNEQIVKTVVTNTLNNIFIERKLTEMIRESELRQKKLTVPKEIIAFASIDVPIITGYQTLYAVVHGENPEVRCIIDVDATNGYELQQMPQFTYVAGLIDTIYFTPGFTCSGKLVLL